jgi:hypothetical protein
MNTLQKLSILYILVEWRLEAKVGIGRFRALFLCKNSQFPRLLKHYLPLLCHYPRVLG